MPWDILIEKFGEKMIVILYVMDSLRPDFLSCYGYGKETSPHIDGLAREGVLFTHAFSQSTWTRPAGASLLSSTYPSVHGILTHHDELDPAVPLLPEALKRIGFRTVALSSIGNISPGFGFARGFDRFIELYKEEAVAAKREKMKLDGEGYRFHFRVNQETVPIATSEDINEYLFPLLEENRDQDLFVLIWSIDTHNPYFHRDPAKAKFSPSANKIFWSREISMMRNQEDLARLRSLYEDMIYYNDYHIGRLMDKLKERNLFDETLFILMGDHGESFQEHGVTSHGGIPYDEQIRIPLVMKFPGRLFRGRVDGLAQQIDVAPTVLDYLHHPGEEMLIQGKSLLPLLREGREVNEFAFVEYQLKPRLHKAYALRTRDTKYIEMASGKLILQRSLKSMLWPLVWLVAKPRIFFDLKEDPAERVNRIKDHKGKGEDFHRLVRKILEESKNLARRLKRRKKKKPQVDEQVANQLKAMGYFD
jgi:arylsulfatase A-like enzyme